MFGLQFIRTHVVGIASIIAFLGFVGAAVLLVVVWRIDACSGESNMSGTTVALLKQAHLDGALQNTHTNDQLCGCAYLYTRDAAVATPDDDDGSHTQLDEFLRRWKFVQQFCQPDKIYNQRQNACDALQSLITEMRVTPLDTSGAPLFLASQLVSTHPYVVAAIDDMDGKALASELSSADVEAATSELSQYLSSNKDQFESERAFYKLLNN